MLTTVAPATTRWSQTRTSMRLRASTRRLLISSSALLTSSVRLGWLCTSRTEAAWHSRTSFTTSRGWTLARSMVPVQTDHAEVLAVPIAERNGEEVPDYLGARQRCAAAH